MSKVHFSGTVWDVSGYGEFARFFVHALHKLGADVSVEPIEIETQTLDFGHKGVLCKQLSGKGNGAKVNVINMVPNLFRRYKRPGCKNVGFTMWEASRTPDIWAKLCNDMDAIFVPCSYNKKVFEDSGVTVPIYVVHPGVEEEKIPGDYEKPKSDTYKFYSIFQWLERKNPHGLIKAYLSEFSSRDKVSLVLKTYFRAKGADNRALLLKEINNIRALMNIKEEDAAKIELVTDLLSDEGMRDLHKNNNCFVLPHKGEGWGLPHFEAMLYGNPVIATNYSSVTDFMKPEHAYCLDYSLSPCTNQGALMHSWYSGKMWWAEADLRQMATIMRSLYENPKQGEDLGAKARKHVLENFGSDQSAKIFMEAVDKVLS